MKRKTTKEIIKETFLHQLSVMPLSKVTVKGIVEETEINRNTFYYYYPDIYAILEELLQESLDKIIAEYDETKSWEESFHLAISFVVENGARKFFNLIVKVLFRAIYKPCDIQSGLIFNVFPNYVFHDFPTIIFGNLTAQTQLLPFLNFARTFSKCSGKSLSNVMRSPVCG